MTQHVLLDPLADPHCGRSSGDHLYFKVHDHAWRVEWGRFDTFGTAAFWVNQTVRGRYVEKIAARADGADLVSETLFCLLGGFGIPAESAQAAYHVLRRFLERHPTPTVDDMEAVLRRPLPGGVGRYRFPRQRAVRLAHAITWLRSNPPPTDPLELRKYLKEIKGVGPKTASWITRNVTGDADVAIVDIWIVRTLTYAGIFRPEWRVDRHYERFEDAFLQYASQGKVPPGALDMCIWEQARMIGHSEFASP